MYAVIESGGKQFRVELGSEIEVDTMDGEPGSTVELGRVLLVADGDDAQIGRPVVEGARVSASVVRQDRGPKIVVFKYRPKARHRARRGHRQGLTLLRVSDIVLGDRSAARQEEAARTERERYRAAAEAEAARQASADKALARKLARQAEAEKEAREEVPARGRGRAGIALGRRSAGRGKAAPKPSAGTGAKRSDRTTTAVTKGGATRKTAGARTGSKEPARRTQAGGAGTTARVRKPTGKSAAPKASGGRSGSRGAGSTGRTQASKPQQKRRTTRGK